MHAAQLGDSARGLLSSVLALGQQPIRPDAQRQCSVGPAAWQPSRRLTSAPAWAGHGPISGGAALAVGSNPTVARPFRPNKNGLVALPLETLDHSFFSFFSALPVRVRWRRRRRWPLAAVPLDPATEPPWPAIPSATLSSLPSPPCPSAVHTETSAERRRPWRPEEEWRRRRRPPRRRARSPELELDGGAPSPRTHGGAELSRAQWLLSIPGTGGGAPTVLGWLHARLGPAVASVGVSRRPFHLLGLGFGTISLTFSISCPLFLSV